jgi:hypothetical protein
MSLPLQFHRNEVGVQGKAIDFDVRHSLTNALWIVNFDLVTRSMENPG